MKVSFFLPVGHPSEVVPLFFYVKLLPSVGSLGPFCSLDLANSRRVPIASSGGVANRENLSSAVEVTVGFKWNILFNHNSQFIMST